MSESNTPITDFIATQSTAVITLLGVVTYLVHELVKNGNLNARDFNQHLDDLSAPDSLDESPNEKRMRASVINLVRKAIESGGADDKGG